MLTVEELVRDAGLRLAAGEAQASAPVRWVHITELADPTPWLSGGELLLTTGMSLEGEAEQRAFVRRLAEHHLAGLGFGTGFGHDELPPALAEEAAALGFPLFEVPYELPFIALTERAFTRLVNEHYEALQRALDIQRRLERLVIEDRGLAEVVRALATAIGGAVAVLGPGGEPLASATFRREAPEDLAALGRRGADLAVPGGARLVAARDEGSLGDFERLIVQQAVTVVALELTRRRAVRDTERRLAGEVLAAAIEGRIEPADVAARLAPFGIGDEASVLIFDAGDPAAAEPVLARALAAARIPALVAVHDGALCAVVSTPDPVDAARTARAEVGGRAATSRPAPVAELRRSFHEARCALESARLGNGAAPEVATWEDLGAYRLLLSLQDDDALRLYADGVLGSLDGDLLRSLEAYVEENGNWERAARVVPCHRHTLRHRIRRIEEMTGRDLGRAQDRIEVWLALRARELVA
ncbi:MAG TPA: PucR family transcriptional regulator [Thermoleophilaceae bacterium]|nr:PucR family transcriptional regulator [Thermoleophilaceae bacterium]